MTPQGEPLAKFHALDLNGHVCDVWDDDIDDIYVSQSEVVGHNYLTEIWLKKRTPEESEVVNLTQPGRLYQPDIHPPLLDDVPVQQHSENAHPHT